MSDRSTAQASACVTYKSPGHVRSQANRALSQHRRMTDFDPHCGHGRIESTAVQQSHAAKRCAWGSSTRSGPAAARLKFRTIQVCPKDRLTLLPAGCTAQQTDC